MAGQYDYSINIPQPPAQNFLQSLLGIQQLKGLQQQSQIAAQQAQFAQQMQPLQLEAERARIAQAKAGTEATQTSQQAAQYGLEQRKALDAELLGISSDPSKFTADNLQNLAVKFHSVDPTLLVRAGEMRKNLPDQAKIFGDNVAKDLVLTSATGDSEAAIKQLDKAKEAAQNTPGLENFVQKIDQLKDSFIKYPDQTVALAAVGQTLFAPDNGKAITDVMAKQADIGKTKAETKKEQVATEGQLLDNRIKQYEADNGISLKDIAKNKEERFKAEASERVHVESQPFVRNYLGKREAFDMMKTAEPTGVGDKVLLVQFTKMGDPSSIVSVTEEGSSRNITLGDYIASLEARIKNNGSLGEQQRKELKDQAFQMLKTSEKAYKEYKENLEPVHKERGLNPKNIFVLPSSEQLREEARKVEMSSEEQRVRGMLRPAAGFGNTITPSTMQPQGSAVGMPPEVQALLNKYR
jgi:hypothetical protein